MTEFFLRIQQTLGPLWPALIFVLLLLAGYAVGRVAEGLARRTLRRTSIDDRLAHYLRDESVDVSSEDLGGRIVFWTVMVLALITAFEAVDLGGINSSLGSFAEGILGFLPNLIAATLLALVAYLVAVVLRVITTKALRAARVDERIHAAGDTHGDQELQHVKAAGQDAQHQPPNGVAGSLGEAVFYFVLLLFLPAVLDALALEGILVPIQELVGEVLAFLPNLLLAGLILIVGVFVARVVRSITRNLLVAARADRLSEQVGLDAVTGSGGLSGLLAFVAYFLVLIPVLVAALNALQVDAISAPASDMLAQFLNAIPNLFMALVIVGIAFVVGKLIASFVSQLLADVGFNRLFGSWGTEEGAAPPSEPGQSHALSISSPSGAAGVIALIAILLFAGVEAADTLGLEALAGVIGSFTALAGRILLGLLIFAAGIYLADLAASAVRRTNRTDAQVMAAAARVSILVLTGAMALREMGLADSVINLAFGLTLGAIAVAVALAYGLGGRDIAREHLQELRQGAGDPPSGI